MRPAVLQARAHRKHVSRASAMYIEPAAFRAQSAESLAPAEQAAIWTQCLPSPLFAGKKAPLKTFEELQPLIQQARKRELKLLIRENSWPINSPIRASLWPALCRQHQHGKSMLDGFYWDMVTQVSDIQLCCTLVIIRLNTFGGFFYHLLAELLSCVVVYLNLITAYTFRIGDKFP